MKRALGILVGAPLALIGTWFLLDGDYFAALAAIGIAIELIWRGLDL